MPPRIRQGFYGAICALRLLRWLPSPGVGVHALREVFHLVWRDADRFVKARVGISLALITAASALTALGPVALKLVVDSFTGESRGSAHSVVLLIGLFVLSQWLARTVSEIRGLVYARAERRMSRLLSERLFSHVMHLPYRFHLERQTGAISQSLQNGLQGYQMVLHTLVFTILPVATELGTIVIVLTRLRQPAFLVLFCGALVFYALAFAYAAMTTTRAARRASAAQVDSNAVMTDIVINYETVKYFTAEAVAQERVRQSLIATEEGWVGFYRRYAFNGLGIATIFAGFLGVTVLYAAHEVQGGRMTVGTFVLLNTYMLQIVRPVEMLGYAMQSLSQGLAYLDKTLELLRETTEPDARMVTVNPATGVGVQRVPIPRSGALRAQDAGEADRCPSASRATTLSEEGKRVPAGEVEFREVCLAYRSDRPILERVSFYVPSGTTLGIVGPSGAGKSTLVRLLVRLVDPDSGEIRLDGAPIVERSLLELRQCIAIVPQDTVLFHDTIGYNIGFGKKGSTQADVIAAAKTAHLHDFIVTLPDGYDTRVGERGVKLSGGERQRVAIARAAIKRPSIYVFDEATSSLDSNSERLILRNLVEISRHTTTLIIAHRLSTVVHADQIVLLEAGGIAERGTHASLLALGGRYASLWNVQQEGSVAA